jgi:hypothetical protein
VYLFKKGNYYFLFYNNCICFKSVYAHDLVICFSSGFFLFRSYVTQICSVYQRCKSLWPVNLCSSCYADVKYSKVKIHNFKLDLPSSVHVVQGSPLHESYEILAIFLININIFPCLKDSGIFCANEYKNLYIECFLNLQYFSGSVMVFQAFYSIILRLFFLITRTSSIFTPLWCKDLEHIYMQL